MRTAEPPTRVPRAVVIGLTLTFVVAVAVGAASREPGELSAADGVVLGIVEGVTEYLPVSSTGHLAVTQRLLGIADDEATEAAANSYAIAIQIGAIIAVLWLYWGRIRSMALGVVGRDPGGRRVAIGVVGAFVPAAAVGFLLGDLIKDNLFGIGPVVAAWFVGGVAILVLSRRLVGGQRELEDLVWRDAAIIGLVQILALWPGVSRSLVTIFAALAVGLTVRAAVEFSFLLGLVTLGAATVYEGLGEGADIIDQFGLVAPAVGIVAAFVSAVVAVRWLVDYLNTHSLAIFGWYRIAIAVVVGLLALTPAV